LGDYRGRVRGRRWLRAKGYIDPYLDTDVTAGKYGIMGKIDWLALKEEFEVKHHDAKQTEFSDHASLLVDT
jgi:hypothetical protein